MLSRVWCRWCIFKEFPHLKWYCIFFFANFCHQAFKSGFHWSIWHYWYDCTGIIGMMVLGVAFVCSAKGGCETQPAAHLDNDMKHNILHIFMHSASVKCILCHYLSSPRAKRVGPKGPRAESARAVTGRRNSYRWEGGRLFEPSAGFFYGNSCNSGTESRKMVSKVGN